VREPAGGNGAESETQKARVSGDWLDGGVKWGRSYTKTNRRKSRSFRLKIATERMGWAGEWQRED